MNKVVTWKRRDRGRQPPEVQALIGQVDQIRGVIYMAANVVIESKDPGLAHAGAALHLAADELRNLRDGIETLGFEAEPRPPDVTSG